MEVAGETRFALLVGRGGAGWGGVRPGGPAMDSVQGMSQGATHSDGELLYVQSIQALPCQHLVVQRLFRGNTEMPRSMLRVHGSLLFTVREDQLGSY